MNIILPHFDKYPLISKKGIDYLLFKQIVLLMLNEGHHTLGGIKKIVNINSNKVKGGYTRDSSLVFNKELDNLLNYVIDNNITLYNFK